MNNIDPKRRIISSQNVTSFLAAILFPFLHRSTGVSAGRSRSSCADSTCFPRPYATSKAMAVNTSFTSFCGENKQRGYCKDRSPAIETNLFKLI